MTRYRYVAIIRRGVARLHSSVGLVVGCSSNITSNSDLGLRQQQASEYAFFSTIFAEGRRHWLAGDFNLTSSQMPSTYMINYAEGLFGFTFHTRTGLTTKIDHLRVHNTARAYLITRVVHCPVYGSDHCFGGTTVGY